VWSSGFWDAQTGELEEDDQLRTYEAVAEEFASGTTFHLLLNDHWVQDTRIPPRGLLPNLETDPVGDRYALQDDGTWPNFDVHTYAFPPNDEVSDATDDDVLDLRVRLLYLINTAEYIQFLADESAAGEEVAAMFDAAGGAQPVELASVELQIPIVGFGNNDDSGTSGDTGDSTTSSGTSTSPSTTSPTTTDPTGDTDTGDSTANADEGGGGDGCGCRSHPTPFGAGLVVLLGFLRRRRYSGAMR
jgi:MYXO-CTERM domain-containing protein